MEKNIAVKDWVPATQEVDENTTDNGKTFEQQADDILQAMNETKEEKTEAKEKVKEESKKEPTKEEIKDKSENQEKEENKIPLSRLNKEIEKRKSIESELSLFKEKLQKEQDRIKELTEDEVEEQNSFRKLGIETKEDKLLDKIETLERQLNSKIEAIKTFEEEINAKRVAKLSDRISELTKEYDWKNWLPKFDIKELLEFWKEENYMPSDPVKLYKMKYQNEIIAQKYNEKSIQMDKWNKESFTPLKKEFKSFDDPEFEKEALNIINWI